MSLSVYLWTLLVVVGTPTKRAAAELETPSFCSRTSVIRSTLEDQRKSVVRLSTSVRFDLESGETICLLVSFTGNYSDDRVGVNKTGNQTGDQTGSISKQLLYTFQYANFHQEHPVSGQYSFGLPRLSSKCLCDCEGGERHCSLKDKFEECRMDGEGVCGRTFHTHQSSSGCLDDKSPATVCCEVTAVPYKGWRFTAVDLTQPTGYAQIQLATFRGDIGRRRFIKMRASSIQVVLNRMTTVNVSDMSLENLRILPQRASWQLPSGMYFYREENDGKPTLRRGPALNRPTERSPSKLGWFRRNSTTGHWLVSRAPLLFSSGHFVKVTDCKAQRYTDQYHLGYALDDDTDHQYQSDWLLGQSVQEQETWLSEVTVDKRQVLVTHRHPPPVSVDLQFNIEVDVRRLDQTTFYERFEAEIRQDSWSNKFLNLTVHNGRGTLVGVVGHRRRFSNEGFDEDNGSNGATAFSVFCDSGQSVGRFLVQLPDSVQSRQLVCLYDDDKDDQDVDRLQSDSHRVSDTPSDRTGSESDRCLWAEYRSIPLQHPPSEVARWQRKQGQCVNDCNTEQSQSAISFWRYLNPGQWFNGISGASEGLALGLDLLITFVVIFALIALCRRAVCPLIRWGVCPSDVSKS